MGDEFQIRLLGPVQIEQGGKPVAPIKSLKGLALLAYLIVQKTAVSRAHLAALFWPEIPEARGRANLSWMVNYLRKLLPGSLVATRHSLQWNPSAPFWVDLLTFEETITEEGVAALEGAIRLYRGEFLEGISLEGCHEFETWLTIEREHWRRQTSMALDSLIAHYAGSGETHRAIQLGLQLLRLEPWREEIHRQVMLWLAHSGQYTAALRQFERCRRELEDELGLRPAPETLQLYRRIRAARRLPRQRPPPTGFLSPFVGRKKELADLQRLLLSPTCKLLTLTGLGGVGKTRLALQLARQLPHAFLEGITFIPLQDLLDAKFLVAAIAQKLNVPLAGRHPPIEQLLDFLQEKEMLLILDGFEHLIANPASSQGGHSEGVHLIRCVLERAPGVKLLTTSRQRLNLQEEWVYSLGGLSICGNEDGDEGEAEQLFYQRARQAWNNFSPTEEDKSSIARICALMSGLPLGIELAAALTPHHSPTEIAHRLESDLFSLTSPLLDSPQRHRSLQAVFAHSWEFLTPSEQGVFQRLAVFKGGFRQEAAVQIAHATRPLLRSLINKSLLRFTPAGRAGRMEMHPLVQQFAQRKLLESPAQAAHAQEQHARYYLRFLQSREKAFTGRGVQRALQEIQVEIENIGQAWQWAASRGQAELLGQGLKSLFSYCETHSLFREGAHYFHLALEALEAEMGEKPSPSNLLLQNKLRARWAFFLYHLGGLAQAREVFDQCLKNLRQFHPQAKGEHAFVHLCLSKLEVLQGDFEAAVQHAQSALACYEQVGDLYGKAASMNSIGVALWEQGIFPQAKAYLEESLHLYRSLGNVEGESFATHNLGALSDLLGEVGLARRYFERSLELAHHMNDRRGVGITLNSLGFIALRLGDFSTAQDHLEQSLQICQEIGDRRDEGIALSNLCLLHHYLGEHRIALDYGRQALAIARKLGDSRYQGYALARLGNALLALGRTEEAIRHYQQALELRRATGQKQLTMETLAALGLAALRQGELHQAKTHTDQVLKHLDQHPPEGMDDACQVYLSCYRVLRACGQAHASQVLQQAKAYLQAQAAQIEDPDQRQSFLENVPSHRELVKLT